MLPNGQRITSSLSAQLNIPGAMGKSNQAHIFQDLTSGNLLSVGQLCDDDFEITFTKKNVEFKKDNKIQFSGKRRYTNDM